MMDDSPKTSVPSFEDHNAGLLSASPDTQNDSRRRSTSVTSTRSTNTIIDKYSNVPKLDRKEMQRRSTQVAEVRVTWWQCLKGVFLGPRVTERAARATIVIPDMEEDDDMFANGECPWILTVHAVSSPNIGIEVHQQGRCTFDTGCLQGNIISKEFASKLGYTESDFKPLRPKEMNGGTSVTGHPHMPEGALHITWYHNSSPKLYNGMRFLVSSETQCELIIGARSILRHKLLSAPNLGVEDDRRGITKFKPGSDKALDKLRESAAKLENELTTLKHNRKAASKNNKEAEVKKLDADIKKKEEKLDADIKKKEKKLEIKNLEVELYSANKQLQLDPKSKTKKAVIDLVEEELKAAKGEKDEKSPASLDSPHVNVSAPNGATRSATGFSNRSGRTRAR